jgi:hypothetical protein
MKQSYMENFTETWNWVVLLKPRNIAQLVKKYSFYRLEGSVPCSQEPATGAYPDPDVNPAHVSFIYTLFYAHKFTHVQIWFKIFLYNTNFATAPSVHVTATPSSGAHPASYPMHTRGKSCQGVKLITHLHLVSRLRVHIFMVWGLIRHQGQLCLVLPKNIAYFEGAKCFLVFQLIITWGRILSNILIISTYLL